MQNNVLEYSTDSQYPIATKKTRIIAFLIDFLIYCTIGIIIGYFSRESIDGIGFVFNSTPGLVMALLGFFLWPVSEALWGQTIGKRMFNLKVVTDHYESIDITASLTRYLLGFIEYMFLIGFIVAINNKKNKRIGDIVANTIIIQM